MGNLRCRPNEGVEHLAFHTLHCCYDHRVCSAGMSEEASLNAHNGVLGNPDLNLDCLEQVTHDAIAVAHETLRAVKTSLNKSA